MRRRQFITLLGGTAVALPIARAQQPTGMRRVGMLMNFGPDEPEGRLRQRTFVEGLQKLGWR